jgi:segregation and condensation protein B
MNEIKNIIESLLFVSEDPLTIDRIRQIIQHASVGDIRDALRGLMDEYEDRKGGFYLSEVAGGYQIRSRPEYTEWIKRLLQPNPVRLSRAALETLATIAYKQPIIRSDIEQIRGVDCGGILRMLLNRKLIRVLGRKEIPGRPLIYATTKHFLEVFELKDLKDLPTPLEIEALGESPEETDNLDESFTQPESNETPEASSAGPKQGNEPTESSGPYPAEKFKEETLRDGENGPQENGKNA